MATKIKASPQRHRYAWKEYALMAYIERHSINGVFQQTAATIATTIKAEERSIQRTLRDLVSLGCLIELSPRHKDAHGWWVPAVYRVQRHLAQVDTLQRHSAHVATPAIDAGLFSKDAASAMCAESSVIPPPPSNDALTTNHITGNGSVCLDEGRCDVVGDRSLMTTRICEGMDAPAGKADDYFGDGR